MKPDRPAPTPFRMDPENPLPRVRINQGSHLNYYCGSMPAVVGMVTDLGAIEKVNAKSVLVRRRPEWSPERVTESLNITLTEARKHGFSLPRTK